MVKLLRKTLILRSPELSMNVKRFRATVQKIYVCSYRIDVAVQYSLLEYVQ